MSLNTYASRIHTTLANAMAKVSQTKLHLVRSLRVEDPPVSEKCGPAVGFQVIAGKDQFGPTKK